MAHSSYNLDKLIKIKVHDFYKSTWYTWFPAKKRWWGSRPERIMNALGYEVKPADIEEDYVIKDGVIYEKPEVVLIFQDDIQKRIHCETYEKAKELATKFKTHTRWI